MFLLFHQSQQPRVRERQTVFKYPEQAFGFGRLPAAFSQPLDQVRLAAAADISFHHMAGRHLD